MSAELHNDHEGSPPTRDAAGKNGRTYLPLAGSVTSFEEESSQEPRYGPRSR